MVEKTFSEGIDRDELVLRSDDLNPVSSGSVVRKISSQSDAPEMGGLPTREFTGVAAELASVELPKLEKENRARLLMQTPQRLFFYWSLKNNPFQVVNQAVSDGVSGYQLVLKLINITRDLEEIYAADVSGSWWFDVDPDCEYRAEVGLYAPNRPYIRVLFSNTLKTPRKRPSTRAASDSDWKVSAEEFADVLSASGFKQDAFEVALSGDEKNASQLATRGVISDLFPSDMANLHEDNYEEVRSAILHLSLGLPLESLKWRISSWLYSVLQQQISSVSAERAQRVLKERFGVEVEDLFEEETTTAAYGASMVNFPRILKRRRKSPGDYQPVSSFR
jgi:hypothetical protein